MATTKTRSGGTRARTVRKKAMPRNRSEEIHTRGKSAWETANRKLNPNASYFKTLHKRQRLLRWYTWGTFWLALPLVIFASVLYVASQTEDPLDLADASVPANASDGKETAFAEMTTWLSGEYSPLPGATIVSWDGYTVEEAPVPELETDEKLPYSFETHRFTLTQGTAAYSASVQVAVSDVLGAVATSTPSYTPIAQTVDLPGGEPVAWFGYESASVPNAVQPAVEDWAAAYTSGSPDELHRAVGDPDAGHIYVPLVGVAEVAEVTVVDAAYIPDPSAGSDVDVAEQNLGMFARVEVVLWWEGQERPERESTSSRPAPVTFDVLIENPNTATPLVTAWGAPGSGPSLVAYENAVNGVSADSLERGEDFATPTPEATPATDGSTDEDASGASTPAPEDTTSPSDDGEDD